MAFIHEIQIRSSGFPGAPGFTNLYFKTTVDADRNDQFTAVKAFLGQLAGGEPSSWSGQIAPNGRVLEETTGRLALFSNAPATALPSVPGVAGANYGAGVAGLVIGWTTATVNRARLVRGRTFLVPVARDIFDADGTLTSSALGQFTQAGNDLIASNLGFCIWSRPRQGIGGVAAVVTSVRVNDKAAFLSSRRA